MDFGQAIYYLNQGLPVYRNTWDQGTFIFKQVPSEIGKDIVPKMQSLPDAVKEVFINRFEDKHAQISSIYYSDQLAIVKLSNSIRGYSPSVEDCLADNWFIFKE